MYSATCCREAFWVGRSRMRIAGSPNVLQTYWTNFAKTGDPNGAGLPVWPKFDAAGRAYLEFTDSGPVAKAGLRRQICDLFMENVQHHMMGH